MTTLILLATVGVSIAAFRSESLLNRLIFNAYVVQRRKEYWRFITCGFIHADWLHLLVNMFVFYQFGSYVEEVYDQVFYESSTVYFLLLYFGGIVVSILPTFFQQKNNPKYNSLGASGGVSSVVFAYILFNPLQKIYLYGIIGLPGIVLGLAYLAYSYYQGKRASDNVNHNAHFWGAIYGVIYTIVLKPSVLQYFIDQF